MKNLFILLYRVYFIDYYPVITISRWENPKSGRSPNSSMLPKLAEALNTSVEYLMGLTESEPQEQPLKQLLENSTKSLPINNDENKEKVKIKDPLFGTQWEYEPNKQQELGLAYWGSVVDNARRIAESAVKPSDLALIISMLKSYIDELTNAKVSKNQTPSVVMNNLNGDNMNVNVNNK